MLLLRAALLEFLVCFHVIGAAVLFRRLFPRESPWLAFILPTLAVMAVFNFLEHFIALPELGWLLPFSIGGLLWSLARPGYSWEGLRLPTFLFLVVFTWAFGLKCLNPEITCNTEGVADMARVVDFLLGNKLPPVDTWCPPYDHGGYYTFQHYGASLLTRLFSLDVGTGYNMGYTLLNTLTCLVGAGAAYRISGDRAWVAFATLLVLLANFTGSSVVLFVWNTLHPDPSVTIFDSRLAVDLGDSWDDPARHNPFGWIFSPFRQPYPAHDPFAWLFNPFRSYIPGYNPPVLRLFTATFNTYFPEFHANLGGHFMTLATMLAANEAYREERSNWPWICLLVFPLITLLTATWFFIIVTVLCAGCFLVALLGSKRPENWALVILGTALATGFIWPSVDTLIAGSYPVGFHWTPWIEYTPFWEFVIQWWPIIVPWFFLCFVWLRLSLMARWIHFAVPFLLIFIDCATFSDRGLTVEKMWGAVYSVGLVTFLPLVFIQPGLAFRFLTVFFLFVSVIFIVAWARISTTTVYWDTIAFHLRGDTVMQNDAQRKRLLQVMKRLHGQTILPGESTWSYNMAPSLIGFSENMCYIAWFAQEYQCGHGGEAEYRNQMTNDFYAGKMTNPLPFLRSNDIAAVLIWPDDAIPDSLLAQFKTQLASDYYYVDCHDGGPNNAGVFIRFSPPLAPQPILETPPVKPVVPPPK
jgi:hypothetical protein